MQEPAAPTFAPAPTPVELPAPTPAPFVPDPALAGAPAHASEPFAPPSDNWRRVSPRLVGVKRLTSTLTMAAIFVPLTVVAWMVVPEISTAAPQLRWIALIIAALGLAWGTWLWFRAKRWVAACGWARRDEDLCVVSGLMFRRLTVVPFGRMQVVRVTSGPLLRARGLANVDLVTASAATDATIPGLPAAEAAELRDLIIELSDAHGSGL